MAGRRRYFQAENAKISFRNLLKPYLTGSHEAIQTFAFNALGLGLPTATAFTMIIRRAEVIIVLVGVVILSLLGIGLAKNTLIKK